MDILIVVFALIFAVAGIIGAVAPVLPGPPLSFVALLLLLLCDGSDISTTSLVVAGIFAVVITLLDYIAPVWLTKKSGGSKYGTWGATIGLIIGIFFALPGMLIGPFLGAYIGELMAKTPSDKAFKVACMSFVAFMLTSGIKFVYSICLLVMVVTECWDIFVK
ncbi:MAG: DUF456 domain-containing protein [Bacteroidaceae bacterium]|nr:DUF456 domain-containing protein [Bacteroidaceae bacterium]